MLRDKFGIDELERLEIGIIGHDSDVLLISAALDAFHDWFLLCIEYIHGVHWNHASCMLMRLHATMSQLLYEGYIEFPFTEVFPCYSSIRT